ncbi:hypothetical protein HPB49_006411 [Dermacentor silvarum]|uniref:Uncharacterized protein n=1 Tax=Dermacentor silvarum TaxID=543639 RepID=A0ACB8DNE0_DERSI|nr:hypothetical protein HPB49_006411 [Dermacentor silvarum]
MAQNLLGDIQLPVGDQQLPFRGHAKAAGEICRGVITINPAETPQLIKSELKWSQGAILAVRKLGDSTAAVVTFEGTKLPRFIFYHSVVAYVRPYKKTIPACSLCSNIGHRPSACPRPTPGSCTRCGTQAQVTPEGLAQHECNSTCLLCSGPHETGVRGCPGKYRKPTSPSTSKPPAPPSPGTQAASQAKPGSRLQTPANPPPTTSVHYPPLVVAPPQNRRNSYPVSTAEDKDQGVEANTEVLRRSHRKQQLPPEDPCQNNIGRRKKPPPHHNGDNHKCSAPVPDHFYNPQAGTGAEDGDHDAQDESKRVPGVQSGCLCRGHTANGDEEGDEEGVDPECHVCVARLRANRQRREVKPKPEARS